MPVQESSATALIRFTGLGIVCFNGDKQRGEIAAIRDNKHKLSVSIQQPVFQDGTGNDLLAYKNIATYEQLPNEDVEIEIKALESSALPGFEIFQPGEFDRLDSPDANDFRWLVNMSGFHATDDLKPTGKQRHPLTKLYIGNGMFYTHKLEKNLFFDKVINDAGGNSLGRETFGYVAETVGVKIEAGEVSFKIRIGDQEETHRLKRVPGLPFKIEIRNMDCGDNAVYSDMSEYYSYLSSADGKQVDLTPILDDAPAGSVNQLEFCHPIVTDLDSIDDL